MQFFSDEYLMHYGIKGMKWKKKKRPEDFKTPGEYLEEGYKKQGRSFEDLDGSTMANSPGLHRLHRERARYNPLKDGLRYSREDRHRLNTEHEMAKKAEAYADAKRNSDLKKTRKKAYKKNQRRIAKQQRKAKVNNALKRVKNKIFVDTSGSTKVGNHLYVEHH